ncbi:MAG: lysophospholipid acyltransferase family protein [Verrucomicrobia bacterium]|nr:lysophospholipid acyltransferase family protein [Verrucomicrobiota bacterium]MCH8527515.1 lysophospholipid acyltransferase family protein [Kiritimatiellia bacterium]
MSATPPLPLRIRHRIEYGIFLLMRGLLRGLPFPAASRFSAFLACQFQETFGWRKATTARRITEVLPETTPAEQARIRKQAARNLGHNFCEILNADKLDDAWVHEHIDDAAGTAALEKARESGKGVLLVITHFGNWDLAGTIVCRRGTPMCFIARAQKNPLTYQALQTARQQSGGLVLDRDDPKLIRKLLPFLADNGVVAILIDIRARGAGETHTFLNRPCRLANGLGLLAAKSGAAVLPVALYRAPDGKHVWHPAPLRFFPDDAPNKKAAKADLLQSCLDDLSPHILTHPESYFWYNKRWVLEI